MQSGTTYVVRGRSCVPPLSFGHFSRERGKPIDHTGFDQYRPGLMNWAAAIGPQLPRA